MPRAPDSTLFFIGVSDEIKRSCEPDIAASPNAPSVFAAPGPVVVIATDSFPVALASPSAA